MSQQNFELELIKAELEFWRDFVNWWENKHGRPAEKRTLEAVVDAEQRYRKLCRINIDDDDCDDTLQHVTRVLN